jgi:hypothetical protein
LAILMSTATAISGQGLPVITLRRTACFGTCPVYSLEIYEDGRLHYQGDQFVGTIGPREAQISSDDVKVLVADFFKIDYLHLKDIYETHQNPDGNRDRIERTTS